MYAACVGAHYAKNLSNVRHDAVAVYPGNASAVEVEGGSVLLGLGRPGNEHRADHSGALADKGGNLLPPDKEDEWVVDKAR